MPQPLEADKEIAKGLILQGIGPTEAARRLGVKPQTVKTWSARYGWNRGKVEVVGETVTSKPAITGSVEAISKRVRTGLAEELELQLADLRGIKRSRKVEKVAQRVELTKSLAASAKGVFGWDQDQSVSVIRVNLLAESPELPVQLGYHAHPALPDSGQPCSPAVSVVPDSTDKHALPLGR